jgi:RimJ/RimL family protein N-acetyltransferase
MEPIQPILTERLELRPVAGPDAAALHTFRGHPDAVRYLSHGALTAEQSAQLLAGLLARADQSTDDWYHLGWAVVLRSTGTVIGDARTWNTTEPPAPGSTPARLASLGYLLHPDHHGNGYGREAAGALVHWLFTRRGADAVLAGVYEPNTASRRLLESLGFAKDRYFTASQDAHGKGLPSWRYRLDREAWSGRPAYGHNSTPGGSQR